MKQWMVAALILSAQATFAATHGIDENFGSGGALLIGPTPQSGLVLTRITAVTALSNGKILVGGFSAGSDNAHPQAKNTGEAKRLSATADRTERSRPPMRLVWMNDRYPDSHWITTLSKVAVAVAALL